jgi:hypothetical protein
MVFSNVIRNASLHAGTPFPELNHELYRAISGLHFKMGLDMTDPRTSVHDVFEVRKPTTDETKAPNTQHAVLLVVSYPFALAFGWKKSRPVAVYALAIAATFLLFSIIFKFDLLGSRYHLPFFVLAGPVVGAVVGNPMPPMLVRGLGLMLVVLSWPWLVGIENRQLLPTPGRPVTVLNSTRDHLYLPEGGLDSFRAIAGTIRNAQCGEVGVMFCGDCPEYLLWVYLGAPRQDLRIEWIVAGTPSVQYADPNFQACAVVCDPSCPGDWTEIRGLPLAMERSGLRLFANTGANLAAP